MSQTDNKPNMALFWGCFIALIATAFGFILRAQLIGGGVWAKEFNLTQTQSGEIFGVGLYPFAISIVIFSMLIDRVGAKPIMIFGFVCHVLSVILTIMAKSYWGLYWATFICALGNGTVEAYINPVVATMFSKDKTKWLNILHAGWPGGLVLGGLLAIMLGSATWQTKVGLILIPTIIYIILLIPQKFPQSERVSAGVSYREMLGEVGAIGMAIIGYLVVWQICTVLEQTGVAKAISEPVRWTILVLLVAAFFAYTRSLGRPIFILLLALMIPLATTELGVDSWVEELMRPVMGDMAPWLLVYTSAIMTVLRFFAGPITGKLTPLGTLAVCAVLAIAGLYSLSGATAGTAVFIAATIYGIGKTFFWPTTLGVVAEQFPKGGALTLNGVSAVGMLGVGIIGGPLLGNLQDKTVESTLREKHPAVYEQVLTKEKSSLFGTYRTADETKLASATEEVKKELKEVQERAKQPTLKTVCMFPALMLLVYLLLLLFYKSRGGYKPVSIGLGH
jgi:MFS family permease